MDSGNSESLHSSSGGDEEYDPRAAAVDSVSAYMRGGPISNPQPPFIDPLSNYLQLHQNSNSSLLDPRITTLRSDPNPVTHDTPSATLAPPPQNLPNPKKRSRASRRAPTTVLTTDTTNFRAMVQEFTGIPAPPFDSSSFPRTRLDLAASPYLRRPFAQKVPPPLPFLAPASAIGASSSSTTNNNNNNITSSNIIKASSSNPAISYQLLIAQSSSNSFQNQLLTNFLQTNPKFPLSGSMSSKTGSFPHTQFGLSPGDNDFIQSDQISLQNTVNDKDDREDGDDGVSMRSLNNGNYNFPSSAPNNKMSFRHGGGKNVAGEGMVESWICSSE